MRELYSIEIPGDADPNAMIRGLKNFLPIDVEVTIMKSGWLLFNFPYEINELQLRQMVYSVYFSLSL